MANYITESFEHQAFNMPPPPPKNHTDIRFTMDIEKSISSSETYQGTNTKLMIIPET
jgi:hypothetical protein